MRIAMISPYGPRWIGGISRFVMYLCEGIRTEGHECELIVNVGGANPVAKEISGPKVVFASRTLSWLFRYGADIVHAHSHWHALLPAIIYKAIRPDVRVVFSLHTPPGRARPIARALMRYLMRRCDIVTAVSPQVFEALGAPEPGCPPRVVIPPGARIGSMEYEQARSKIGVAPDQFVVTCVSLLVWPEKAAGVRLLVRAFERFAGGRADCRLFVVGGGPYLASLRESVASNPPDEMVSLVGETPDPEPFLKGCDVYAHVSYKEGVPLSMLDAMGAGKAIVASRVGGIPGVLRDGESGILVSNEETQIAQALDTLYRDNGLRGRLGSAASFLARTEYTWEKVADRFLEVYRLRHAS